jgi:hypothetical protein
MSLRAFHLLFILLSALLAVFVAAWASGEYRAQQDVGYAVASVVALAAAGALAIYAMAFRRKTKHL